MATTTPNFGWDIPQSTDLVKDGATAIAALGNDIDTSMVDLKGGTTGQVLSKASNTDMDFTWVAQDDSNAIQNTIVDAKGDLISATAADTPARLAVGTNGQVLTADSSTATGLKWAAASGGFFKNPVLNSNFSVWQRGTSFAGSTTGYGADRWMAYSGNSSTTFSRQATGDTTNLPFIQYAIRCQRNNGSANLSTISLVHNLETVNSIPFAGKTITLSFYARAGSNFSSSGNALGITFQTGTGTDQNIVTGYTGAVSSFPSFTLTTTWQRFSTTINIGATATQIGWYFTYTPTGTAGAADYYEVTGVQLEVGSSATDYYPNGNTYQAELAACQRYYVRWQLDSTIRGLPANSAAYSTTLSYATLPFPVQMRTYPTVSVSAGTIVNIQQNGTTYASTALTADSNNLFGTTLKATTSGMTAGHAGYWNLNTANCWIDSSAEL